MNGPTPLQQHLLQFAVTAAVIGSLAVALLDRLYAIEEQTERMIMEATLRNMETGLRMEIVSRMIHGPAAAPALAGANPVDFLERPPEGYRGTCRSESLPGTWCFDAATREIVYHPRRDRTLQLAGDARLALRWKVDAPDGTAGSPIGAIALVSTTKFTWQ